MTPPASPARLLTELGYYTLARHPARPADLLSEAATAERIGLGAAFVSERFNVKDAAVLSGALTPAAPRLGVATAATNHHTRHPLVTATMGATLAELEPVVAAYRAIRPVDRDLPVNPGASVVRRIGADGDRSL